MVKRRVFDNEKHVDFVMFSCDKRRNFLQQDQAKRIVIGQLGSRLSKHDGLCTGFVIMPDHVHALVWFPETG
jgi:putative transposase